MLPSEVRLTVEYAAGLALWKTTCRQATEIFGLTLARLMALEHCLSSYPPPSQDCAFDKSQDRASRTPNKWQTTNPVLLV